MPCQQYLHDLHDLHDTNNSRIDRSATDAEGYGRVEWFRLVGFCVITDELKLSVSGRSSVA